MRSTPATGTAGALALPCLQRFEALRQTLMAGFPPLRGVARVLAGFGVGGALELARTTLMSARDFARELFAGEAAAAWLYGAAMHGDVSPEEPGSAIMALYLQLLGHHVGYPSPRGGAGALAAALVKHLRGHGGVVRTAARAERVVVRGGRVCGVQAGGERYETRRLLCDVTPRGLLAMEGGALPMAYRRRLARFRHGGGVVKVDWALGAPIPWEAPAARRAGTVHLCASDGGADGPDTLVLLGQQSVADPTRAPEGAHTAWAYARQPRGRALDADAVAAAVASIEAQVERFAPGFVEWILARHVLAPGDLERRNRNLVGGDVGAGSYALDQLIFRPLPKLSPYRTPIRGLYLASASTFPGGAVHGACGHAAARCALHDARIPGR